MKEDMVMRSVYIRPSQDSRLRQLAFHHHVTKSDLIRSAISAKLDEWLADPTQEVLLRDLELGRRSPGKGNDGQARDDEPVAPVDAGTAQPAATVMVTDSRIAARAGGRGGGRSEASAPGGRRAPQQQREFAE
jgi:hypothetical protein